MTRIGTERFCLRTKCQAIVDSLTLSLIFRTDNMSMTDTGDDSMENYMNIFKIILCTLLLASLMSCAGTDTKQSTGQYVDDSAITAKVKAAIFDEDSLKSRQINVETFKGVVQLSGFVDSSRNSSKAEQIARDVDGVKSVINNIVVK